MTILCPNPINYETVFSSFICRLKTWHFSHNKYSSVWKRTEMSAKLVKGDYCCLVLEWLSVLGVRYSSPCCNEKWKTIDNLSQLRYNWHLRIGYEQGPSLPKFLLSVFVLWGSVNLRTTFTVSTVWNSGETGDINDS